LNLFIFFTHLPVRKASPCLLSATFRIAEAAPADYGEAPATGAAAAARAVWVNRLTGIELDDNAQKSCWGVTAKALIGFAGIILLAWLFSGGDAVAILAAG